ncbi:M23 family metallopeptidase [Parafrigoribacterium mesophilum]|uniref:M23 family metallopeptidase n=1 Tax=Parafrigoribacterium mesophilum TaxID=433646 RepID=UPI0031FC4FC0
MRPRTARLRASRLLAVLAIIGMVATVSVVASNDSAWAKDYPSWADVLAARNNEAAKQVEIGRVKALIKQNEEAVASTQAIAQQKGEEFQKAQQAYDEAAYKAEQLQQQADAAKATAAESQKRAGQMAARLARVGGNDVSTTLFFNGDKASDLLSTLGMASKITDQSEGVYAKAVQDQNNAQSRTDQANVAKEALKALAAAAEQAMVEAQAAVDAAAAALKEQQDKDATLQAQLATLTSNKIHTEAEYGEGVRVREAAAAALRKKQAEEAAAAAAAAAAAGGGGGGVGGQINGAWARPAGGYISSNYGSRVSPCAGCSSFHEGVDLAAGCGAPIYAAHAGTVAYAGGYGGYGNYIRIDHGGGIATAYGHIVNGGTLVRSGQHVGVGQLIARVGSTGNSTGCHLHFEVRINGTATNPVTFMSARGITLG